MEGTLIGRNIHGRRLRSQFHFSMSKLSSRRTYNGISLDGYDDVDILSIH